MQKIKIIVAGPRDYENFSWVEYNISKVWKMYKKEDTILEIVEGGATGVDALAKQVAKKHNLLLKEFPAQWNKYALRAGPIRNSQMADYGDALIAFRYFEQPASKGTENMIKTALDKGLHVHVIPIKKEAKVEK